MGRNQERMTIMTIMDNKYFKYLKYRSKYWYIIIPINDYNQLIRWIGYDTQN